MSFLIFWGGVIFGFLAGWAACAMVALAVERERNERADPKL